MKCLLKLESEVHWKGTRIACPGLPLQLTASGVHVFLDLIVITLKISRLDLYMWIEGGHLCNKLFICYVQ
jgi:hypothetical protein